MEQGISLETMILLAGFAVLVSVVAWHRSQLDGEIEAFPDAILDRMGWKDAGDYTAKQHRRRLANRLILRGLPGWTPLSAQGWRHLLWLRVFALVSVVYIVVVPPLVAGEWVLLPILGVPTALTIVVGGWVVGPWKEP